MPPPCTASTFPRNRPFWIIPLLAIAGLHMREIMGYCFMVFFAARLVLSGALLIIGG
ncbi:TIGR00366 family protein [Algihabitans albus]|uniref:TIGR00366 family protein n=1 Tax=Algihabitans albus TaxID=2164067 RepID=UPI000E5D74AC|nr:TIGR00366 family protein [Algihabitans albus]